MSYKPVLGGVKMAIPKGDLYEGAVKILRSGDLELYDPAEIRMADEEGRLPTPLTGEEGNREAPPVAYVRDLLTGSGFDPRKGREQIDEIEDKSDFIAVVRPQEFRARVIDEGVLDLVLGAGYDIEVNYARLPRIEFNGMMHDPEQRLAVMEKALRECGYEPVMCAEYKPTVHVIMSNRRFGPRELDDLRNGRDARGLSEFIHMSRAYAKKNGLKARFPDRDASGGVDDQVGAGLADIGHDLMETGSRMKTYADRVTLLRDGNGEVVTVSFSLPWVLARQDILQTSSAVGELADRLRYALSSAKADPRLKELFTEKYLQFLQEWDKIDAAA